MSAVKIGSKLVGDGQPCYVIAEIGINHNGDIDVAKRLIDIAKQTKGDAIAGGKGGFLVVFWRAQARRV